MTNCNTQADDNIYCLQIKVAPENQEEMDLLLRGEVLTGWEEKENQEKYRQYIEKLIESVLSFDYDFEKPVENLAQMKSKELESETRDLIKNVRGEIEDSEEEYNQALDDLKEYKRKQEKRENLEEEIEKNSKKLGEIEERLQNLKEKKDELEKEIEDFDEVKEKKEDLDESIDDLRDNLTDIEKAISSEESKKESLKERIGELQEEIKEKEEARENRNKIISYREWLNNYLSNLMETMEKHYMGNLQKRFNQLFGEWFQKLVEEKGLVVRVNDRFAPVIEQEGYQAEYENLSGGEKSSVALAYRLALNEVINSQVENIKTKDLLILDEPTDGFSSRQLDKIRDILNELSIRQTIVVSHEPKLESYVDNVINVYKEGGVSRIES